MAKVVTKRSYVRSNGFVTDYYITFEFENDSNRIEYRVSGETFGLIGKGDRGILSYQEKS